MDTGYDNQIVEKALLFFGEFLRNQSDYFKHLTTLSTGSILIVIALAKEVFKSPKGLGLIVVSFIFFLISLIGALYMMQVLNGYNKTMFESLTAMLGMTGDDASRIQGDSKKQTDAIGRSVKVFHPITDGSFSIGIIVFIIFAIINLF